jgi:cathepsin L
VKIRGLYSENINGEEATLKARIATYGPAIVYIYADEEFMTYKSGVYSNTTFVGDCKKTNHAVVLVGYGTDPKLGDFW